MRADVARTFPRLQMQLPAPGSRARSHQTATLAGKEKRGGAGRFDALRAGS
jgi:hypothetical protein